MVIQILRQDFNREKRFRVNDIGKLNEVIEGKRGTYCRHHLCFVFLNVGWLGSPAVE